VFERVKFGLSATSTEVANANFISVNTNSPLLVMANSKMFLMMGSGFSNLQNS
jgi:hypothetical protein